MRQVDVDRLARLDEEARELREKLFPGTRFAPVEERDRLLRLLIRLDRALDNHAAAKRTRGFADEHDEALIAAHLRVRRDWQEGRG